MSSVEEIRKRLERDYSFVEGRRKALADIAYLLERVEDLEGALEHTLTEINDAVRRGIIPVSAVNTWKADQALEDDDADRR